MSYHTEITTSDVSVCVLAYNEEKHIEETIRSIRSGNENLDFHITVYANGCTDRTGDVVRGLQGSVPNLRLRELTKASKPHAWNTAFAENHESVICFSDGDVRPESGTVAAFHAFLDNEPQTSLLSAQFWPSFCDSLERRFVGFLQIPLVQDFHSGQFYAIRRSKVAQLLEEKSLSGIPEGIVGEDVFLELLVGRDELKVAAQKVYYDPPSFDDYCKYLARMRWQERQLASVYGDMMLPNLARANRNPRQRMLAKLRASQGVARWMSGGCAVTARTIAKTLWKRRIDQHYAKLGPVTHDGADILSKNTRSESSR